MFPVPNAHSEVTATGVKQVHHAQMLLNGNHIAMLIPGAGKAEAEAGQRVLLETFATLAE